MHRRSRLGHLESGLLEWLWTRGWVDVSTAHAEIGRERAIARNTVHSTLERLVRKRLAERRREGRAYRYRARVTREAWVREALGDSIDGIPGADPLLLLAGFVDLAERLDDSGLEQLERLVRARRRARDAQRAAVPRAPDRRHGRGRSEAPDDDPIEEEEG